MRITWETIIGWSLAALLLAIVVAALVDVTQIRAAQDAHLASCEYTGTRIEAGWGGGTVHTYDCDEGGFESRRLVK